MHQQARDYVARQVAEHGPFASVLEIGSRDINGGVRDLFGDADYTGLDVVEGPGVDVVADATTYKAPSKVECVVCCEVLEHTPDAEAIVANARANLAPGGVLILTAATDPREPHSAVDGAEVRAGEYYANVDPNLLREWLPFASSTVEVDLTVGDIRAVAVKRARR